MPQQITEAQEAELLQAAKNAAEQLQKAYQIAFSGAAGEVVWADIQRFCRMESSAWSEDQRHHARLEGRREVGLRIQDYRKLPLTDLLQRLVGDSYTVVKIDPEDLDNG